MFSVYTAGPSKRPRVSDLGNVNTLATAACYRPSPASRSTVATRPLAAPLTIGTVPRSLPPSRTLPPTTREALAAASAADDRTLGEYIVCYASRLRTRGWQNFITGCRLPSDFASNVQALPHHAAQLLDHLRRHGASVPFTTAPWTQARLDAALARGSHHSAIEHLEFLQEEILSMMQRGQWVLLPYALVKHLPNLRLSPLGVVPQRDRRPRVIVDYTFNGINADTLRLAPTEAMQFGKALQRILQAILHADPRFGPVYLIKVDIANGFYRVWLNTADIPKLGVVFPTLPDSEPLVAFPLVLPMGWTESPPYFCAATETAMDLANQAAEWGRPPPH